MRARQPVSLDGIEFDALVEITENLEADAPEYPVEDGYSVNDTIVLKPRTINLVVYLSNTPVSWKTRFGDTKDRVNDVCTKLYELYEEMNYCSKVDICYFSSLIFSFPKIII